MSIVAVAVRHPSDGHSLWELAPRKVAPAMCFCPAHDDRSNPSLSLKAANGKLLLHCFAGCKPEDIVAKVGLGVSGSFDALVAYEAVGYLFMIGMNAITIYVVANVVNGLGWCDADDQFLGC